MKSSFNSYLTFERLTKKSNISVKGKNVIEIGSGWLPLMPYLFKYRGEALRVKTYDLNEHYNINSITSLNREFARKFNFTVEGEPGDPFNLPEGIEYFPHTDLTKVAVKSADIVFSRFVLEHVRPVDIIRMHQKFKLELPEAYIIHLISPSDHRAYEDKNLSNQDFLRFSAREWEKKQTKFDYHNRLRLPQYLKIFKELGYEILLVEYESATKGSETYKKFKKVAVHVDYQQYSDDDLTAGSINVILKLR